MQVAWCPVLPQMLLARFMDIFVEDLLMFCLQGEGKLPSCGDVYDISISKKTKKQGASALAMF